MIKQNLRFFFFVSLIASTARSEIATSSYQDPQEEAQAKKIRNDIKERQQKLNAALIDYANPNCLKKAYYGQEHYKAVYSLFIQCAGDASKCTFGQKQLQDVPEALITLADAVRRRNLHLEEHFELSTTIKASILKRDALVNAQ